MLLIFLYLYNLIFAPINYYLFDVRIVLIYNREYGLLNELAQVEGRGDNGDFRKMHLVK